MDQERTINGMVFREGADFQGAYLEPETDLANVNMKDINFKYANLTGVIFRGANLTDAKFQGRTDLTDAKFQGAILTRANFQGANLTDANFTGADLTLADLRGATIVGAIFTDAILADTKLDGLLFPDNTVLEQQRLNTNEYNQQRMTEFSHVVGNDDLRRTIAEYVIPGTGGKQRHSKRRHSKRRTGKQRNRTRRSMSSKRRSSKRRSRKHRR